MIQKKNIEVNADKCKECFTCQLVCSITYAGTSNIFDARILIGNGKISFTEACVEGCLLCANYCAWGAIKPRSKD